MENKMVSIRASFDGQCIRAYVGFIPPTTTPDLLELPERYHYADKPGYQQFLMAFDAEYAQGRFSEAREFYEEACQLDHPFANYCYGLWFLSGDRPDTPKDLKKAFHKFCAAHKFGFGRATYQLADFYRTGKGKVTNRDEKKAFAFLLQSVLDPRIHRLLDGAPFWLLGLCYALAKGPSTVSITEATRCFDKATRYATLKQNAGNAFVCTPTVTPRSPSFYTGLSYMGMLVFHFDENEKRRQIKIRRNAMGTHLDQLPAGQSMLTMAGFAGLAKQFGLLYDDYMASLAGSRKANKRVTWKTFRALTDGHAQILLQYERQAIVECWQPLEPDDPETRDFVDEMNTQWNLSYTNLASNSDEDYGFYVCDNEHENEECIEDNAKDGYNAIEEIADDTNVVMCNDEISTGLEGESAAGDSAYNAKTVLKDFDDIVAQFD